MRINKAMNSSLKISIMLFSDKLPWYLYFNAYEAILTSI